eukprot:SAG25_NODE_3510_length_1055_cov_5.238494_1_plen_48_part_00
MARQVPSAAGGPGGDGLACGWRQEQVATYQFETTASNEASENWLIRC